MYAFINTPMLLFVSFSLFVFIGSCSYFIQLFQGIGWYALVSFFTHAFDLQIIQGQHEIKITDINKIFGTCVIYARYYTGADTAFERGQSKNVLFSMCQRRLGAKKISNFPMLHIAKHFCVFSRNFQSFLTLIKQQLLHFLGFFFLR